ncbi:hypothetical protein MPSEU_000158100 [Mayamaea pseudoterrestris]|nr:hypothetical protein MPSEU_000158100 [Mayamaea pseudoterrestris]
MLHQVPLPWLTRKGGLTGFWTPQALRDTYVQYLDVADLASVHHGVICSKKLELMRESTRLNLLRTPLAFATREKPPQDCLVDHFVTIVHGRHQTLDVWVPDEQDRDELVKTVKIMIATYRQAKMNISNDELLLRYIWFDIDVNRDGEISKSEWRRILQRINWHHKDPKKPYKKAAKRLHTHHLTYVQVVDLLHQLKNEPQPSMENQIWNQVFGANKDVVTAEEFLEHFYCAKQMETDATLESVTQLFTTLNGMELSRTDAAANSDPSLLSRARFDMFLHSEMNSAYNPLSLAESSTPLNEPLSRYWINTSHNTYLSGDQLASASSVQMYRVALQRGCKCLELDCWDGEETDTGRCRPVIFHGHTLTSKILFEDVVRVVHSYMLDNPTTYPVILSLENHCSHPFQSEIAKTLKDTLGNLLYVPSKEDKTGELPSPESLRGKVIIKGKRPPEPEDDEVAALMTKNDDADQYDDSPSTSRTDIDPDVSEAPTAASPTSAGDAGVGLVKPLPKIVSELAKLTLFHGTKHKDFYASIMEPPSNMHSIGETKIGKILAKSPANITMWRLYNVHHMTRTYPAGTRVDSSNYNPILAWYLGCQLVALNYQTNDSALILNDGLFRQGGCSGYVRKPDIVMGRSPEPKRVTKVTAEEKPDEPRDLLEEVMDGFEELACGEEATKRLIARISDDPANVLLKFEERELSLKDNDAPLSIKIRILSGSCLPKSSGDKLGETIDPYVTVSMHDVKRGADAKTAFASQSHKTATISDNGFCPVWNEATFTEFLVYSRHVAMVQFDLWEEDVDFNDKLAHAAIPIQHLRPGYRSIILYDSNNTRVGPFGFATLLVEIDIVEINM